MMDNFLSEYLILLTDSELDLLTQADNREHFVYLKPFLHASKRLRHLRLLGLPPVGGNWQSPLFIEKDEGVITDNQGNLRGQRQVLPLPIRPGEPQLGISYDWFWGEFCQFLIAEGHWAFLLRDNLQVITPAPQKCDLESAWLNFWNYLGSEAFLERSLTLYLNFKTLFKKPAAAAPWTPKEIPIISQELATHLVNYYKYGPARKKLFKNSKIPGAIKELETFIEGGQYVTVPFPQVIENDVIAGGDFKGKQRQRCLGCGTIIPRGGGYERRSLFLKDADERPQSGSRKDDYNRLCTTCVATVLLCPIKLTPETLVVRFRSGDQSAISSSLVLDELRRFVVQTLNLQAGEYISLHLEESVNKTMLCDILGYRTYAQWKMATTFPAELFAQGFRVEVFPGEESFILPRWLLWITASLCQFNDVFRFRAYQVDSLRPHFQTFLRLLGKGKIFAAFYTAIKGGLLKHLHSASWLMIKFQDILAQFEVLLKEEHPMPIPDYTMIVGFAGLLLPLATRVESAKIASEKKRTISKLLEEVDRPIQFVYTAARESNNKDFLLCRWPRNRYFYDQTTQLLAWAGEDVEALRSEARHLVDSQPAFNWAKEAEDVLTIGIDQIMRVTGALIQEGETPPYKNEADWRAFAYQVKLALWSQFPQYLQSE